MIEELLPASIALVAQMNMDQRVMFRLDRFFEQLHAGNFRSSAALFDIARRTGADNIVPGSLAPHTPGNNMIQRQLAGGKSLAAILAPVLVAGEDIAAIELYLVPGKSVIKQQPDNSRYGDMEIDS